MRIFNAMFGRGKGGIEQAFVDYSTALMARGHEVFSLIHPDAAILQASNIPLPDSHILHIRNKGQWDIFAVHTIRQNIKRLKPDIAIGHGNRAISLLKKAAKGLCPVVGLAHNYRIRRLVHLDAAFSISHDLKKHIIHAGGNAERIFVIPNMIHLPCCTTSHSFTVFHNPPVIGAMGRFVHKKGFEDFIRALDILRRSNIPFKAVIGGEGEEEETIKRLVADLRLEEYIHFMGWVKNKESFFHSIDVFCLPSLHEPFGIVLLEAMSYGVPVVTTDTEGPVEIARDRYDALIVPKNNPSTIAEALKTLLTDTALVKTLSEQALHTIETRYEEKVVAELIEKALEQVRKDYYIS